MELHKDITLYTKSALEIDIPDKFRMIYFDPPFNSDRDYRLNCECVLTIHLLPNSL